ncbi:putative nucleotidyltransferase, ribonuclease H [Tanacetum coccineum]
MVTDSNRDRSQQRNKGRYDQDQRFAGRNGNDRQSQSNYNQRQHRGQSTRDSNQGHASGSASQRRSTETLPPPPLCTTCGKPHPGVCHKDTRDVCYLRDNSHKVKDCPQGKQKAENCSQIMQYYLYYRTVYKLRLMIQRPDVSFVKQSPVCCAGTYLDFSWEPKRDMNLAIDLIPGAEPIPKAPVSYGTSDEKGRGICVDDERQESLEGIETEIIIKEAQREDGDFCGAIVQNVEDGKHTSSVLMMTVFNQDVQRFKQYFWGNGMKQDVATFVSKCMTCQQVKIEHQRASGLLQPLEIPMWKWDEISMDFVTGLPTTQKRHDAIWVVVDRLTKSAHFLPIRKNYGISKLAEIFQQEIVRLHGTPTSIVSDRDPKFTSHFWKGLQKAWGTRLKFSTAFHPQTDGQSERTIQTLEDMLRACALEWTGSWDEYLCLVEFAYNNSWHASIKAAPFELLYGRKCRAPICWDEVGERLIEGPELIEITNEKVAVAKEKLKEARSRQKSYADKHRRDLEFQVGDRVFLKVSPFRGVKRFGIKGKLSPRFIGPFEILERIGEVSYRLALPPQLSHVHDVFHVSLLRGYHYHPLHVASYPFDQIQPDMSLSEEPESILDRQERVMRNKVIPFVKILWKNHPEREATWETEESMRASYPHFFV